MDRAWIGLGPSLRRTTKPLEICVVGMDQGWIGDGSGMDRPREKENKQEEENERERERERQTKTKRKREREREICIRFLGHIAKERVDLQTEAVVRPCLIQTGASATSVWKSYISIGFSCECCTGSAKDLRPAP